MKVKFLNLLLFLNLFTAYGACADNAWLNAMIEKKKEVRVNEKLPMKSTVPFNKTHTLVFFYASTCKHCHHFAPVLQSYAKKSGLSVLALSFDNTPIEGFNIFKPVTTEWVNVAFEGKEIHYPALFIMNQKTNALYPVSFGAMSYDELQLRMQAVISKILVYETSGVA